MAKDKFTIEFAHICENVIVSDNNNLSIINVFNQISAEHFPTVHPVLFVVIGVVGSEGDYPVDIRIEQEGDVESVQTKTLPDRMTIPKPPAQGRLFVKFSPLVLKSAGKYKITIFIEREKVKTLSLEAKLK